MASRKGPNSIDVHVGSRVLASNDAQDEPREAGRSTGPHTHKFKVGDVVNYRPADRNLRHLRGAYTITRALPGTAGQPEYRVRRADEEHERVARESELSEP